MWQLTLNWVRSDNPPADIDDQNDEGVDEQNDEKGILIPLHEVADGQREQYEGDTGEHVLDGQDVV